MLFDPAFWALLSAAAWAAGAFWQMWLELDDQYRSLRVLLDPLESLQREEIERRLTTRRGGLPPWKKSQLVRQVTRELNDVLDREELRQLTLHTYRAGAWVVVMAGAVFAGLAAVVQLISG